MAIMIGGRVFNLRGCGMILKATLTLRSHNSMGEKYLDEGVE
jgi:hypothetical protein